MSIVRTLTRDMVRGNSGPGGSLGFYSKIGRSQRAEGAWRLER